MWKLQVQMTKNSPNQKLKKSVIILDWFRKQKSHRGSSDKVKDVQEARSKSLTPKALNELSEKVNAAYWLYAISCGSYLLSLFQLTWFLQLQAGNASALNVAWFWMSSFSTGDIVPAALPWQS